MNLFYREYGDGPPLIILHGLYGSSDNWISIAKRLSEKFRVILPDQRNHGKSEHDPDHSYSSLARDIKELTEKIGIERFFLAGHSMGGKTAIWFASSWPEKLLGLTVIDISPFKPLNSSNPTILQHKLIIKELIDLPLDNIKSREEADTFLSKNIHSNRIRSFLLKNLTRDKARNFTWKLNPLILSENLNNILEGMERNDVAKKEITGFPVLFIRAGNSDYIPAEDYELIQKLFPASEILTVEDSSHWIHAEKPEEIIKLLMRQAE